MTTQSLLNLQKKRSCLCLWTTPLMLWIQCMSKFKNKSFAQMEIANELVKMEVDSGASCNVLPRTFFPRDTEVKKTNLKTNLKVLGVAKISLRNPKNKKKYRAEFAIINEDYTPLLGSSAAQQMGLKTVQQENILQVKEKLSGT